MPKKPNTIADIRNRATEEEFLQAIVGYAKLRHWRVAHFRPARTGKGWRTAMSGDPGWPDLVLVRIGIIPRRIIVAELKSAKGTVSPEQQAWLDALRITGKVEVYLWRPDDWITVISILE